MRACTALPADLRPAAGLCFPVCKTTFIFYGLSSIIRQILYTRNTHRAYNFYLKLLSNSTISFYPAHILQKNHIPGITLSYNPVPPRTRFPFHPVL